MKIIKFYLTVAIFFLSIPVFGAAIAVSDLEVQSDNPNHKYIGKGLAELISFELGKSKNVTIISREKRSEMLEEVSFSMSGAGDTEQQIKAGKILSAEYIIYGSIINMGDSMLISMKMIQVETGKIVWQETKTDKLSKYNYITAFFTESALKTLNAKVDKTTMVKLASNKEIDEKAAISFSNAINAYDNNDTQAARNELQAAKKLDPENGAVKDYINKLSVTSSKFKVEPDFYVSTQNPAALGTIQQDKIYFIWSFSSDKGENIPNVGDGYGLDETGNIVVRTGYEFPIGKKAGLNIEFMFSQIDPKITAPYSFEINGENGSKNTNYFHPVATHRGLGIGFGYSATKWLSLGFTSSYYETYQRQVDGGTLTLRKGFDGSIGGGFILTLLNNRLYIDSQYTYCMEQEKYLNPDTQTTMDARYPSILETTVTGAFFNRKLFIVGKEILDFYEADSAASNEATRTGYMSRTIPSVEIWPTAFFSIRAGAIYTVSEILKTENDGIGAIAGATLRLGTFDIDFNYTYMERVSRLLPGYETDDNRFLFQISKNATFIKSRK
jgi:TolB-like protein